MDRDFLCECQLDLKHASILRQLSACTGNKSAYLSLKFVVNMGFYQLLHNNKPTLTNDVKPKVHKRPYTFNVHLCRLHSKPIGKPADVHTILNCLDSRGRHEAQTPSDSWESAPIIPYPYIYFIAIFSTAFMIFMTAVVIFVICRHFKLQPLDALLALAPLPKAEAKTSPSHTVVSSTPYFTVLATVITIMVS